MRKILKVSAAVFGLLVLLAGMAVAVLAFVVDPNRFKPQLAAVIKEKTGYEAEFAGDLHLSVFPWLGVSVDRLHLKNPPEFGESDFLIIEQSEVKVKALPLLARKLEIGRIDMQGLRLNLIRTQEGVANWSRPSSEGAVSAEPAVPGPEAQDMPFIAGHGPLIFAVEGWSLEGASIGWDDRQAGTHFNVDGINLNAGKLTPDRFTDAALRFSVIGPESRYRDWVDFKTRVRLDWNLDRADLADAVFNLTREGENVPGKSVALVLSAPEIAFEKNAQSIRVDKLQVQVGELAAVSSLNAVNVFNNGADVRGNIRIQEFNPTELAKRLAIPLPQFQDDEAFSKMQAAFDLQASRNAVHITSLNCKLDDSLLQGEARVEKPASPTPAVRFNLAVDRIDADRYFPKNKPMPVVTPTQAIVAALSQLPAERLKKLDVQGNVDLQQLKFGVISAEGLHLNLNARDGAIETRQNIARFNQGGYSGSVSFNTKEGGAGLSLMENVENVDIEAILKAMGSKINMSGSLTGSAILQGPGNEPKRIMRDLKGRLAFMLKDGEIKDLKFQKIIDQGLNLLDPALLPPEEGDGVRFSEISGSATLADGVFKSQDLVAKSPRFRITGSGAGDTGTGSVDYRFVTRLVKGPATATEPEALHDTPIVITMQGTLSDPVYRLDTAALLTEKNKAKIEKFLDKNKGKIDKLKEKLDKKLGPGVGDLLQRLF